MNQYISKFKDLFGLNSTDNDMYLPEYDTEKIEWMQTGSEASNHEDGILGDYLPPLYWYSRSIETAPDYETPILSGETKTGIQYAYICSHRSEFTEQYRVNEDITLQLTSDGNGKLELELIIDDFEKWASTSRLHQDPSYGTQVLGLGGYYYVQLTGEIEDALNARALFFECDVSHERYSTSYTISGLEVENILNEYFS